MRSAWVWVGDRPRVALLFGLLVLAGAVATAPRVGHWSGSWKQALDNGVGSTVFVGPAAAGAACLVYARLRSSAMGDIVLQSRLDWQRWLRPFLTIWALASLALLLVAVAASSVAAVRGAPASPVLYWIVVPACGVLAGQTALGVLIGHLTAREWAAPAAVVLVFLLYMWTTVGGAPDFFDTGGATASLGGMTYRAWPPTAIGLAGLALAGVALVLAHPRLFLATPVRRVVALGVGAAWVGAWWFAPGDAGDRVVPIANPPLTCAGAQPEVCLLADLPLPLDDFTDKVDRQAAELRAIGVSLPERFVATPYGPPANPRDGVVNLQEDEVRRTVDVDRATDTLVRPAACPADYAEGPPVLAFDVRRQLGRWLQFRAGLLKPDPSDGDYDWLHADPEVQDAWVRTTYRQLAECRYDEVRKHG